MKILDSEAINIIYLADLYGGLLTDNQRNILSLFYESDCSLAEIAEQYNISRQAVRDAIKKAEATLLSTEEKLGILSKMKRINTLATDCRNILSEDNSVAKQALDAIVEITEV